MLGHKFDIYSACGMGPVVYVCSSTTCFEQDYFCMCVRTTLTSLTSSKRSLSLVCSPALAHFVLIVNSTSLPFSSLFFACKSFESKSYCVRNIFWVKNVSWAPNVFGPKCFWVLNIFWVQNDFV